MDTALGRALLAFRGARRLAVEDTGVEVEVAAIRRGQPLELEDRAGPGAGVKANQQHARNVLRLGPTPGGTHALGNLPTGQEVVFAWLRLRRHLDHRHGIERAMAGIGMEVVQRGGQDAELVSGCPLGDLANLPALLGLLLDRLRGAPGHIVPAGALMDFSQGLAAPSFHDRRRHVGDPGGRSTVRRMLAQVEERFGGSDTTRGLVSVGEVILQGFLSLSKLRLAAACANVARSVADVPIGDAVALQARRR
jgi:hypothetical protein